MEVPNDPKLDIVLEMLYRSASNTDCLLDSLSPVQLEWIVCNTNIDIVDYIARRYKNGTRTITDVMYIFNQSDTSSHEKFIDLVVNESNMEELWGTNVFRSKYLIKYVVAIGTDKFIMDHIYYIDMIHVLIAALDDPNRFKHIVHVLLSDNRRRYSHDVQQLGYYLFESSMDVFIPEESVRRLFATLIAEYGVSLDKIWLRAPSSMKDSYLFTNDV